MAKSIGCVIFDCDGTLVDSEYLCNLGLEIKLRELGVSESASEMMDRYRGNKLSTILEDLQLRNSIELPENFVKEYRHLVTQLFERELKPTAGVELALEQISLPMCVASSGPIEKILQALRLTGLEKFFGKNIYSSYVINSWKPSPGLFLAAAEGMGVSPAACIVIEDSLLGIEAAEKGGMKSLLYDPLNIHFETFKLPRERMFKNMAKLPEILNRMSVSIS